MAPIGGLPCWQSHKRVHAAQIESVAGTTLVLRISRSVSHTVQVEAEIFARYTPVPGDFYVIYDLGTPEEYASISPRKPFEAGYDRLYGGDHG